MHEKLISLLENPNSHVVILYFHTITILYDQTSKHLSLVARGKVFNACVRSAMLHGSETWAPSAPDLQRLRRNDRAMVRPLDLWCQSA